MRTEKPFVIRDPVHGYIRVAPHERAVVDHPIMQRLRSIGQTGLAHLVYPEATTSRFVHSLGAMHLSSKLFASCINNASRSALHHFLSDFESEVQRYKPLYDKHDSLPPGNAPESLFGLPPSTTGEPDANTTAEPDVDFYIAANPFLEPLLEDTYRGGLQSRRLGLFEIDDGVGAQDDDLDNGKAGGRKRAIYQPDVAPQRWRGRRLIALAEASVRLAALFHDLGHLPLSHDMELAIKEFATKWKAPVEGEESRGFLLTEEFRDLVFGTAHETVGHTIGDATLKVIYDDLGLDVDAVDAGSVERDPSRFTARGSHVALAFALARDILFAEPSEELDYPNGVLQWLHTLVDGEIDADRADYLLRDGRAFGFKFANYDLDRLMAHCTMIWPSAEVGYETAILGQATMEAENFLMARARSNATLGRHHKIAQTKAALRYACVSLFNADDIPAGQDFLLFLQHVAERAKELSEYHGRCSQALKRGEAKPPRPGISAERAESLLQRFVGFTDHWVDQAFRELSRCGSSDPLLTACLGLILYRDYQLISLWKRREQLTSANVIALNSRLAALGKTGRTQVAQALESEGILIVYGKFNAYKTKCEKCRPGDLCQPCQPEHIVSRLEVITPHEEVAISRHSAYVMATRVAWENDVQMHAFAIEADVALIRFLLFLCGEDKTREEVIQLCRQFVIDYFLRS